MKNFKTFEQFTDRKKSVNEGDLSFTHDSTEIVNPFYDMTGRSQVNPQTVYGDDYINSDLHEVVMSFKSLTGQTQTLLDVFLKWKESGPEGKTLDDYMKAEKRHMKPAIAELRKCLKEIEKYI